MPAVAPTTPFDFRLAAAWLAARSIARGLPPPEPDRGGLRVDTGSAKEAQRWLFPEVTPGLIELGRSLRQPRYSLKLCGPDEALMSALPSTWRLQSAHWVMATEKSWPCIHTPPGYRLETSIAGAVTHARILDEAGNLAASGYAAETADVFIYDRIETAPEHQRKGLGGAVMSALAEARRGPPALQILVATEDGRRLYERLGWTVRAPYASAAIPAPE